MKFSLASVVYIILTFAFLWQITKDTCSLESESKTAFETPWEESGDEDNKSKDTDGEEDDKNVYTREENSVNSFTLLRHQTFYRPNHSEQIREIVSPPPKA